MADGKIDSNDASLLLKTTIDASKDIPSIIAAGERIEIAIEDLVEVAEKSEISDAVSKFWAKPNSETFWKLYAAFISSFSSAKFEDSHKLSSQNSDITTENSKTVDTKAIHSDVTDLNSTDIDNMQTLVEPVINTDASQV